MNETLAIATISWARNSDEEKSLRAALTALSKLSLPVFITDGGSSEAFRDFLHSLPGFRVFTAKGLWAQAKNSIAEAKNAGAKTILYTEPDKLQFFQAHLPVMLKEKSLGEEDGVVLASRSANGFATFPSFQQTTETAINNCCKEIIGKEVDYCYGPFLFNTKLISYMDLLPQNCGWGWRPFVFAMAHRLGLTVNAFVGDFYCPPDQQEDDPGERIYRMKQLTQNIDGLVLAATVPLET